MKKFTKILESKYDDINDLILYLEDITDKISIENIDYNILKKETINILVYFNPKVQLGYKNIDEFEKITQYHKSITNKRSK
jgi:hypothetical protein